MKICNKCKVGQSDDSFSFRDLELGKRSAVCKTCVNKYSAEWYQSNKYRKNKQGLPTNRKWRKKRKAELQEWYFKIKETSPCMDCNKSFPHWIMQFDHKFDKKFNVATMIHEVKPVDSILEEMAKCDLVCANCHMNRTYLRRKNLYQKG